MRENLQLLQTLTSRIIHDLAGSVGAIETCLSLTGVKDKHIQDKARIAANQESRNLIQKIRCFRSIYGIVYDHEPSTTTVVLHKLLNDFFENSSIKPNLHFEEGIIYLDSLLTKASVCLAVIASESISSIGEMNIFFGNDEVNISVNGKNLQLNQDSFPALTGNNLDEQGNKLPINISNCREHYVNILCKNGGYKIIAIQKKRCLEYNIVKS